MTPGTQADNRRLRDCFGKFATGVTVVTCLSGDGTPKGMTVNSFSSLSLDPPLVQWGLGKASTNFGAFEASGHFVVNVLSAHQHALANRFAKRGGGERFDSVSHRPSRRGPPILDDVAAWILCRKTAQFPGGDHVVLLGEVEEFDLSEHPGLVFLSGQFGLMAPHADTPSKPARRAGIEDAFRFIVPLLLAAGERLGEPFYEQLGREDMTVPELRILGRLAASGPLTSAELANETYLDTQTTARDLRVLVSSGLVRQLDGAGDRFELSDSGRRRFADNQRRAEAYEQTMLTDFDAGEIELLKELLRRIIASVPSPDPSDD